MHNPSATSNTSTCGHTRRVNADGSAIISASVTPKIYVDTSDIGLNVVDRHQIMSNANTVAAHTANAIVNGGVHRRRGNSISLSESRCRFLLLVLLTLRTDIGCVHERLSEAA